MSQNDLRARRVVGEEAVYRGTVLPSRYLLKIDLVARISSQLAF